MKDNNYNNEETQYQGTDSEATQFETVNSTADNNNNVKVKPAGKGWKKVAAGAGTGLLIGTVSTALMGMKMPDGETGDNHEEASHPEWADDQVHVATSVNDDMSFDEAFAAARADVGPGGAFEWHGQIYSTYIAEEWDSMTAEQRTEFGNHFNWDHIDHSSSNVAEHATARHTTADVTARTTSANDDIEVVSVNHNENDNNVLQTEVHETPVQTGVADMANTETEVEILGVVHNNETGANIGGVTVGGQEVILIDMDDDMTFDYMATDVNDNGQIDQNELVDISEQNITVNDLGGFSDPMGNMLASNDDIDYTAGDLYEG